MNTANKTCPATSPFRQTPQGARASKILCIDDDPNVSEAIARRLHRHGVQVVRAFHGMQGYWLAVTERPDVILLDLAMPKGEGDEIIECLKRNPQTADIPVIVLTGKTDPGLRRQMRALGAAQYLTKPIPFDELLDELSRLISVPNW